MTAQTWGISVCLAGSITFRAGAHLPAPWNLALHRSSLCSFSGCSILARVSCCQHSSQRLYISMRVESAFVLCDAAKSRLSACHEHLPIESSRPCTASLLLKWPVTHDNTALLQVLRSQLLANRLLPEVSHAVVATQSAHAREGREEASIDLRQMERHFLSLVEVLAGQQSA